MMVYWTPLLLGVALLCGCRAVDEEGGDLDAVLERLEMLEKRSKNETEQCMTSENEVGSCISPSLCEAEDSSTDGSYLIDIRSMDGPCSSYLETCCSATNLSVLPKPIPEKRREGCGWRNPDGVDMLTTGDTDGEAKYAEFPWMVAILIRVSVDAARREHLSYVGGGSLVHPSVVLTAAHVALGRGGGRRGRGRPLRVRAGDWDTQTDKEPHPHQDRDVINVVVHRNYSSRNLYNDVALLFLEKPMMLAPNVGLVCLPPSGLGPPIGAVCLASGWGKDRYGLAGKYQVILKKVELPAVGRADCLRLLRQTSLGRYFQLHDSFMCAGGVRGRDTCHGDGGSPLVCPVGDGRYVQSGIVAWGMGCGEDYTPGVYVNVAALRDWIDRNVAAAGYDTALYTL